MSIEDLDKAIKGEAFKRASEFVTKTMDLVNSRIGKYLSNECIISDHLNKISQEELIEQVANEYYIETIKTESSSYSAIEKRIGRQTKKVWIA